MASIYEDTGSIEDSYNSSYQTANRLINDSNFDQFDDMEEVRDFDAQAIAEYERRLY